MHLREIRAKTGRMFILTILIPLLWLVSDCTSPTGSKPIPPLDKWLVYKQSPGKLVNNYVNAFMLDRGRTVWIATNDGASSFSGGSWGSIRGFLGYPHRT